MLFGKAKNTCGCVLRAFPERWNTFLGGSLLWWTRKKWLSSFSLPSRCPATKWKTYEKTVQNSEKKISTSTNPCNPRRKWRPTKRKGFVKKKIFVQRYNFWLTKSPYLKRDLWGWIIPLRLGLRSMNIQRLMKQSYNGRCRSWTRTNVRLFNRSIWIASHSEPRRRREEGTTCLQ